MSQMKSLSLVVPFYNESRNVERFSDTITPILEDLAIKEWEVICVDDGSQDDSLARLIALHGKDGRFKIVELSRNFGKEAAMTAGLLEAKGDAVIVMDADLQDPPDLIPEMLTKWRGGADVVLARRVDRSSDGHAKRLTAAWFYRVHNALSKVKIPENVGDFRLMDRVVINALAQLPERQRFMKGLFAWVGFRTETIDYTRPPRLAGKTSFSGLALWNLALESITGFSTIPLRIWTYIGFSGACVAALYGFFILVRTLITGTNAPGYPSLFCAVIFFGSVQIMSIGMLGEYIGRIYMEAKQRPLFIKRRVYAE